MSITVQSSTTGFKLGIGDTLGYEGKSLILVQMFSNKRVGLFVTEGDGKGSRFGCVTTADNPESLTTEEFDAITQGIPLREFEHDLDQEFEMAITITDKESVTSLCNAVTDSTSDLFPIMDECIHILMSK